MKIFRKIFNYYKSQGLSNTFFKIISTVGLKLGLVAPAPYEYVQNDVENNWHRYLKKSDQAIKNIVIVGAHHGDEVIKMSKLYPSCMFYLFEPFENYYQYLNKRFNKNNRMKLFKLALSDKIGTVKFYDTNIEGSQSILKPGLFAMENYNIKANKELEVDSDLLDNVLNDTQIDCLWIDVQGAELQVLNGARESLLRTSSIFIEVSIKDRLYDDGVIMSELNKFLAEYDFTLISLGTDNRNLTGNAFYMKIKGI